MQRSTRFKLCAKGAVFWVLAAVLLAACGPSEQRKAQLAEQSRIECQDKLCEGDVPPTRDPTGESLVKVNGQWFIGPSEYFNNGGNSAAFFWPSKSPGIPRDPDYPERSLVTAGRADEVTIEIFLRSHDGLTRGLNWRDRLQQAEADGRLISKEKPRAGLEVWRTRETDGAGPGLWYVAADYVAADPNGAVLSCRQENPMFDICTTGFIWLPGISADMRFRSKHSADWPEIYQEANRVLRLLKRV